MVRVQELLVVQHVDREGPGLLAEVAAAQGIALRILRPFAGDALPPALRPEQILAVMGGPMGVADIGDPAFPWLEPLVTLIRRALAAEQPVLGFCLGAQLLAQAAGGGAGPLVVLRLAGPDGERLLTVDPASGRVIANLTLAAPVDGPPPE